MTTTCNTVFCKAPMRFMGKCWFRTFAGILALFLAATLVPGYAKDTKQPAAKTSGAEKKQKKSGHEEYTKGMAAFKVKDFKNAVKLFLAGAEKGDTDAMVMMSHCLETGRGGRANDMESVNWCRKAADAGNALAQAMYGLNRLKDSEKEGLAYLKKSAEQDCVFGQYYLGVHYLQEGRSDRQLEEGVSNLRKAASHSFTSTKNVLDCVREDDTEDLAGEYGFSPDMTATDMCIILSQFVLGSVYLQGKGVKQDFAEARKWLSLSKKNGLPRAGEQLELLDSMEKAKAPAKKNAASGDLKSGQ